MDRVLWLLGVGGGLETIAADLPTNGTEDIVVTDKISPPQPRTADRVDTKVNTRIVLAVLWICHFILWIFGDMFTLMQEMGEPATSTLIQFVAPTTAIALTLLVAFTLVGRPTTVRLANMIVAPVYFLLNVGFFVDATEGWEYYLGAFYVLFNVLIFWQAYRWSTDQ